MLWVRVHPIGDDNDIPVLCKYSMISKGDNPEYLSSLNRFMLISNEWS